jgi:hypothetical protein
MAIGHPSNGNKNKNRKDGHRPPFNIIIQADFILDVPFSWITHEGLIFL